LKFSIDFRQVYQMVLEKWLQVDPMPILGEKFRALDLV
jgi:hypothetical protein